MAYAQNSPHTRDLASIICAECHGILLDKVGLLDEDFFMYGEDIDLSYRLMTEGYDNWYIPAKILHYKGESTQKSSFRYVHVFYEAMLIFLRKHYSHTGFWLYIPIKTAIYVKASFALVKILTDNSLEACRQIANRNGLIAEYIESDEYSNKLGHTTLHINADNDNKVYAVYDITAYKYETILEIFSLKPNKDILIGTYLPQHNMIITDKEIIS